VHLETAISAVRFDPLLPTWLLAAAAVVCVLALLPAAIRRARGALLRAACFAVLLVWLAGPRLVQETRQGLPDIGVLLVDRTASMGIGNRAAIAEAARAKIEAEAARLPDFELRTVAVPESGSEGTQMFAALNRALADIPRARLSGVIAITDGMVHDAPKAMPGNVPLHVLIPAKGEETDRRLRIAEAPTYGLVGHSVTVRVAIEDLGLKEAGVAHSPASARLTIRRNGEPPRVESVPVGRESEIEVPITRAGPTVLDMEAEPLPGAATTLNNRAVVEINGVRDRLRVLLVSGEPHQGERTWRRLLTADPSVDLVHFTILRPPEKDDLTPLNELALIAFPVRELFQLKIREFDLIILDRFQNRGLLPTPYLHNIAEYVRNGGALLLSVGPEFTGPASLAATPLGAVLPGRPAGLDSEVDGQFRPMLTGLGSRHPVTAGLTGANDPANPDSKPAWGAWYRHIGAADVHGETLMTSEDGQPLLVLDRVGKGRAALLLSDQIWLWSRGHLGGGPQAELLRRIAHWTMQEPELEENALTARVENGMLSVDLRTVENTTPGEVTVTDPDGATTKLKLTQAGPGHGTATMPADRPGVWQVTDGTRTAYAAASVSNPLEFADLRATATVLAPLVRASGGSVHWLGESAADPAVPELRRTEPDRDAAGSFWIGLPRRHDHLVTGIAGLALLPSWVALPLMLGLAVGAWRREST
jgi:hypothetical protein